jgi:hypothetical protein
LPLTEQERLLLRLAHRGDADTTAILNPDVRAAQTAKATQQFQQSGSRTVAKQGSRVPIPVNTNLASPTSEITYLDVGQEIEASLDGYLDGVRLRTKVVQSSIAEDKSGVGAPIIRQTTFEGTSTLVQGKPLILGSLDVAGSTRHQEVEVVSELIR